MFKGLHWLYVFLSVLVITGIAGGAYYLGQKVSLKTPTIFQTEKKQTSISPQPSLKETQGPLFSGSVKKISKDLGLFKISDSDKQNGVPDYIVYYEAGIFTSGEFKNYTRVLAIRPSEGPGPSFQFILATKDYKSFYLDDPESKAINYPESDWDSPYMYIDKSKIAKTVTLDTEHPKTISLDKPYGLIKEGSVLSENKKTGQKDKNGNDIYLEEPITEFDQSQSLTSSEKKLKFYAGSTDWGTGEGYSDKEKKLLEIRKKYLHSTTLVHVQDSTGLTYSYLLSSQKDIDEYLNKLPTYEQDLIAHKKQVVLFNEKKLKEYPTAPEYLTLPGMKTTKSSSGLVNDYYSTYESAFPGACGGTQSTFIIDLPKSDDLVSVSSSSLYPFYILKDNKHPLYELAYQTKTDIDDETYKSVNDGKSKPTFEEYVAKHPLLIFKDVWGRWGVIGEFDIKLMGGCGKPVVYLYPEKSTTVHLSFTSPVSLNTQIPFYHDGWLVKAKPDGILIDLQPQFTDCSKIDSSKFGSEYTNKACIAHTYPYIYWSGKSAQRPYPKVEGGWIVDKENLQTFMDQKLKEIGLTKKESNDMASYWVPKMSEKNAPFYQVGFLTTSQMNEFIPMNVNPQPDSVLRVFLDYKALNSKPSADPIPQQFDKFTRNGFTLVEWGGLQ
ncbi:MAG: hypothetical protein UR54_C0003G0005 [Candidatus Roizmanbacteria bacterium GW2011_GWA2_34_18]|uniref:Uncharacterized protein n=1 Tax=Candidatus Roizmanbacteria bacterium GW2011_GWA2_34_18 TaxID=1618477 RepID=A0A0G0AWC7_9BACT|nr:MAG: hypothetical protein UR54_C0003G0005 [Candidatus Roizmanbacteria bacterium GW2011_GWA2_34_18]